MLRLLYDKVGKYIYDTYEIWEDDFDEKEIWCAIAFAHEDYISKHPNEDPRKIAIRLTYIAMGLFEKSELQNCWITASKIQK